MNVERLREVRERILAEPKRFDMDDFAYNDEACGTTCCIGGWGAFLAGFIRNPRRNEGVPDYVVTRKGQKVNESGEVDPDYCWEPVFPVSLGLTMEQARRLFLVSHWPDTFECAYANAAGDREARARIAAKRITHFIRTKGKE